jgi:ACS family hexuronate transporter-like MFS transporter
VKSNAEWFPVKERALAQGLFGAGGSIGNILAPIVISMLFIEYGWQKTFIIIGSLGIIWIIPWLIINKKSLKIILGLPKKKKNIFLVVSQKIKPQTTKQKLGQNY